MSELLMSAFVLQCFNSTEGMEDVAFCAHKPLLYPFRAVDLGLAFLSVGVVDFAAFLRRKAIAVSLSGS